MHIYGLQKEQMVYIVTIRLQRVKTCILELSVQVHVGQQRSIISINYTNPAVVK